MVPAWPTATKPLSPSVTAQRSEVVPLGCGTHWPRAAARVVEIKNANPRNAEIALGFTEASTSKY